MNWYIEALKKYAVFNGRAQRKEFWIFSLVNFLIWCGAGVLAVLFSGISGFLGGLFSLYALVVLPPWAAVSVRRLHDIGHTGWWLPFGFVSFSVSIVLRAYHIGGWLIPVIAGFGFVWMLLIMVEDSHPGTNQYGPDPKERIRGDSAFSNQQNTIITEEQKKSANAGVKDLDEDAYMERIIREAEEDERKKAARRKAHPTVGITQQKDAFIVELLKSATNEYKLYMFSNEELLELYERAQSIDTSSNKLGIALSDSIDALLEEIKKRGLSQDSKPREISNYEDFSFIKTSEAERYYWWILLVLLTACILIILVASNFVGRNKAAVIVSTSPPKEAQYVDQRWKESLRVFFVENPEYERHRAKNLAFVEAVNRLIKTEGSKKMTDKEVLEAAKKECDATLLQHLQ